ncbi:MAG: A/G-specific adenine glycosylase [Bryobacteraceae bacterium]|nr:A/G-specific adenine glycosylase [Bryobacteraceae bacterium]
MKFSQALIQWYEQAKRDLPWRHTADPYRILVSEVMLQQTRATTVIPYYERFLASYPTAAALAAAPESELLAMWSGLGYYSRARNLQLAAREAATGFPRDYDGLRALPGVGDYTAAAVASIAFGLPYAVLDGNVVRTMARVTNDAGDVRSPAVRRRLQAAATERLDAAQPGLFNQAMMELGATLCTPRKPQCLLCPVAAMCAGRKAGRQDQLPVKLGKAAAIEEHRTLYLVRRGAKYLFWRRPAESRRLAGFHELPEGSQLPQAERGELLGEVKHAIVNHRYTIQIFAAKLAAAPEGFVWLDPAEALTQPISTIAKKALGLVRR